MRDRQGPGTFLGCLTPGAVSTAELAHQLFRLRIDPSWNQPLWLPPELSVLVNWVLNSGPRASWSLTPGHHY